MIQPYYDSRTLEAKPRDVLVSSYPKTGTTWTSEICYLIMHDLDLAKANSDPTEKRIPFIEIPATGIQGLRDLPEPRLIKTHLPYEEIPSSFLENKTKIIYIARNFKDTIVSNFHFVQMLGYFSYSGTFEAYFEEILAGRVMYSSFADNVLSYWNRRHDDNICFLTYEKLTRDFPGGIRKIAKFLGKDLTDEEVGKIAKHCGFDYMSKNPMTNYTSVGAVVMIPNTTLTFMRKGKVGDWKNYFTDEMSKRVDEYIEKHFKGTGLQFEYEI